MKDFSRHPRSFRFFQFFFFFFYKILPFIEIVCSSLVSFLFDRFFFKFSNFLSAKYPKYLFQFFLLLSLNSLSQTLIYFAIFLSLYRISSIFQALFRKVSKVFIAIFPHFSNSLLQTTYLLRFFFVFFPPYRLSNFFFAKYPKYLLLFFLAPFLSFCIHLPSSFRKLSSSIYCDIPFLSFCIHPPSFFSQSILLYLSRYSFPFVLYPSPIFFSQSILLYLLLLFLARFHPRGQPTSASKFSIILRRNDDFPPPPRFVITRFLSLVNPLRKSKDTAEILLQT